MTPEQCKQIADFIDAKLETDAEKLQTLLDHVTMIKLASGLFAWLFEEGQERIDTFLPEGNIGMSQYVADQVLREIGSNSISTS